MHSEYEYIDLLRRILHEGRTKEDRTGTGTRSVFGHQMRFDLKKSFPLLTTKKMYLRGIFEELMWFLRGETNIIPLLEKDVHIWSDWPFQAYIENQGLAGLRDTNGRWMSETSEYQDAKASFEHELLSGVISPKWGELGPVYGQQWVGWTYMDHCTLQWKVVDQIGQVLDTLRTNPDSRRMIVTAWNPGELDQMALPPCHMTFQFYTRELSFDERIALDPKSSRGRVLRNGAMMDADGIPRRALSCQLYQRSADAFLGVPYNIASYSLLTHLIADQVGMVADEFVWTGGDCHIYSNHVNQVSEQIKRDVRSGPHIRILRRPNILEEYQWEDIEVVGYNPHPSIKAPVAV